MKKTRHYSSINQVAAYDKKRVEHLGKYYASIDFEVKEYVNPNEYKHSKVKPVIGTFVIGNRRVDVTYSELNQIMRTANNAMNVCDQAYRMGKWGKANR